MEQNEGLARLEKFVERLIASYNQLKAQNSRIAAELQAKEQENVELRRTVEDLRDNRSEMHSRVTGLLERIDTWEKTFDQESSGQGGDATDKEPQGLSGKSSSLFDVASEQPSGSALR
jgi:predicted RNase H-like nuclease (RuvC/YqgF family)